MRILTGEEVHELYPELFEKVFGFPPDGQVPRTVVVQEQEDGTLTGFVSGYLRDRKTFYISWAGSMKKFTGSRELFAEFEMFLKNKGVQWFTTCVENTNTATQRLLMKMYWYPYGMKMSQGKIYVEYYKELSDGIVRTD